MSRGARVVAVREWNAVFGLELVGARRRALVKAVRAKPRPTLRDLLSFVGEQLCDIADTPEAGDVRLGDLLAGRDGEGPFVGNLLQSLGIDPADSIGSARALGLDLDAGLSTYID
jgi:hypothetical protein